jgi:hypothetical protein
VSNFAFRLQKVYEYRELEEGWAKDNFLAKHITRMPTTFLLESNLKSEFKSSTTMSEP